MPYWSIKNGKINFDQNRFHAPLKMISLILWYTFYIKQSAFHYLHGKYKNILSHFCWLYMLTSTENNLCVWCYVKLSGIVYVFLALSLSLSLNLNVVICLNAVNFIAHLKSILQMVCMKRQSHNYILSHILVRFDKHNLQSKMVYTIQ